VQRKQVVKDFDNRLHCRGSVPQMTSSLSRSLHLTSIFGVA